MAIKSYGSGEWELYNLRDDLAGKHNLADKEPKKLTGMLALWDGAHNPRHRAVEQ